ncbi:type II toxin-antitoxin system VapC family toxin [Metabacillus litoralis]|uniref:type II toxin-antitoxin system VapC family toxin n=1 Tax=Metabacillus TaxID=2675233 RepID=UPI001B9B8B05|nr:type II toxin-antitoxin system VapC family toxin [Metabacillus litoralis]MCM3164546.1 type II toxin-antitoxin system VapC family toxin [Metabacillus litoralis]
MSKIIKISEYNPKREDRFFFDANIWMHLFCSVGNYFQRDINSYNSFFQRVLEAGSNIYVTSMVISEFFNAYCRVEYEITRGNRSFHEFQYKRDFRKSEEFEELIGLIHSILKRKILKNTNRLNDDFESINIDMLFSESKDFDFNDQYFIDLCKENSIAIVTHDRDFFKVSKDVTILTNHKRPIHI